MNTIDFLVRKDRLASTELREMPESPLREGRRLAVEKFALTANNITYAAFGDAMNYFLRRRTNIVPRCMPSTTTAPAVHHLMADR